MRDAESSLAIGVDIGGTKIMAGCVTQEGHIQQSKQIATPSTPTAIIDAVGDLCLSLYDSSNSFLGIGIGTAGIVDTECGQIIYANENLPGWTGTNFFDLSISKQIPITVENDVRAMAYAEAVLGVGREYQSVLCVTVGTGIGGGLIMNGEIWHGATYSAGEIGCLIVDWKDGKPVIFDQFASGPAIERDYQTRCQNETRIPLTEISIKAQNGDDIAKAVIQDKAMQFGAVLGGYVTTINPQAVVISGGVSQIGDLWWKTMERAFYESMPPPVKQTPIMLSSLGIEAVMLGAAMLAWKRSDG